MPTAASTNRELILPEPPRIDASDDESPDVWGFRDTHFQVNSAGHVELSGSRYALSGHELPSLLPWMSEVLSVRLDPRERIEPSFPPVIPDPVKSPEFEKAIRLFLKNDQISADPLIRLRHGHGHTQEEMYAIKHARLARVPDLVVFPQEEDEVQTLVNAAAQHNVCLIPYGGGTNVTEALRCPEHE